MTFLPIVERELRVAARRKAVTWTRVAVAGGAMFAACALLLASQRHLSPHEVGKQIFVATSLLAFGFALLAGIFLTADCLCSERRDGTLGLLFLTDLRGFDVVLGKLAATSLVAAYAMLGIIPVLGLPLLMGGTDVFEFARMALVLGLTLLLSLATGMFMSALCRDTKGAMLATFGVMLALTGGLFLVFFAVALAHRSIGMEAIVLPSPVAAFIFSSASEYGRGGRTTEFWTSIAWLAGLAFGQLALASWLLPRTWRQSHVEPARRAKPAELAASPRRLRGVAEPFHWLVAREKFPGRLAWVLFGALIVTWLGFYISALTARRGQAEWSLVTCMFMAFGLHVIVKGMLAVQASRRFSEDRRSGALELILVTPLSVASILDGHWRAVRRQFAGLLLALMTINFLLIIAVLTSNKQLHMPSEVAATFTVMFLGGVGLLFSDFRAIGWVGMSLGAQGMRHHRAVLATLVRTILPSWVMIFFFIFIAMAVHPGTGGIMGFVIIWTVVGIAIGQTQARRAKFALTAHLRRIAAGDFDWRNFGRERAHWRHESEGTLSNTSNL